MQSERSKLDHHGQDEAILAIKAISGLEMVVRILMSTGQLNKVKRDMSSPPLYCKRNPPLSSAASLTRIVLAFSSISFWVRPADEVLPPNVDTER